MKKILLLISGLILNSCSFVAPVNERTKCEHLLNGVNPMDTSIRVNKDIKVKSKGDSRYTNIKKGLYFPAMQWEKCKYVSYAGMSDLEIKATNKFMNFWEKGNDPGGIQILTSEPNKVQIIWYYRSGSGFLGFTPENGDDIDFDILYRKTQQTVN